MPDPRPQHGIYRSRDAFPRVTAITFTLDARTHGTLDFGIGRKAPNLEPLGEVHDFTAALRAGPAFPLTPVCSG